MKNRFHPLLTAALWAGFFSVFVSLPAEAGFIQNGEFDDVDPSGAFRGWATLQPDFAPPTRGDDAEGAFAVFSDGQLGSFLGPFGVQIQQPIVIPQRAFLLSFDYLFESNGQSDDMTVPDLFNASLLDEANPDPLFGIPPGVFSTGDPVVEPAFFSVDDGGDTRRGPGVSTTEMAPGLRVGWTRVSVDLRNVPVRDLLLEFAIFDGFDSDVSSTVLLDNVVIQASTGVIPEPGALVIWLLMVGTVGCFAACRQRSIRTACPPEPKLRRVIQ